MTRGKQSFLGGAALLTVTMLVTKAIGALYKIPLGNLLDEQGMNYFYAAYNIYNLLLMVSTAGLPLALSRLVSQAEALGWVNRRRRIVSVAFWLFLLLGLLSSGLMFFLAGDLAGWMHNTQAEDAIRVLSPAVLCVCLVSVIRGYTQGMGDMRPTAASEIIESGSKLVVGLGLAWWLLRQGYPSHIAAAGAIAGVTAGVILSLLALTVWTATHLSRDKGRDDPGQSWDILRQLLAIGVPITVGSVSLSVINLLDQSITMGILQTSWGLTEPEAAGLYGTYSYAGNLFALPAAFIYPLTISLIPAIGAALARGDRSAAGRHTAAAFRLTALLALPAGVGLSVLARPILELLYPAKGAATLEAAAYHLEILGVGSIFVCLMALSNGILQAYGREKVPLWTLLAGGGLKIALNYLMISNPDYGIRGLPVPGGHRPVCAGKARLFPDIFPAGAGGPGDGRGGMVAPPAAGRPAARGSGHPAGGGPGGGDLRRGGAAAGGRGPGGGHGPARRGASCPLAAAEIDENSVHFSRKTASSGYFADKRTCNRSGNMVHFKEKARYDYDDLLEIIRVLRSPEGCPWDQVQTHQSIRRGLLEEAYEAAEGIDRDDADLLREELGDVLMQVVFHADIERQRGRFTMEDVVDGVVKKLIFRHPHVFGGAEPEKDAQSVLVSWDAIKRREKHQRTTTQAMDSVARSLPALWRAEKLQKKAADDGFDWPDIQGALSKLDEEVGELHQAVQDGANVAEELGDVLFAAVKAARFAGVDPEDALNAACEKFIRRYGAVEQGARDRGVSVSDLTLEEMTGLWNAAK